MKALLSLGIVLGLLMIFPNLEVTAQRGIEGFNVAQEAKNIEICTQNLIEIGKSIQIYQKENGDYPKWLSDLHHPKYLPDPDILICPSDEKEDQRKAKPVIAMVGKPMPDFTATDLNGHPISLQNYRGKVVLLDFWAVWCGPCIAEMPNVKRVYDKYKDKGFDIIGISLDTDEKRLRNYLKEKNIAWRQVFSGKGWQSPVSQQYGIRGIPAPWLIGRDGTLITKQARGRALGELVTEALQE